MIDALIAGKLYGKPAERISRQDRVFATAKVRVATREDSLFVGVVAFKPDLVAALLALDDGDSVALSGQLKIAFYTDRQGEARPSVELLAEAITTPYHVSRKRAAQRPAGANDSADARTAHKPTNASAAACNGRDFNDPIPF